MDESKQLYLFKRQKFGHGTYSTAEHTYICSEDSTWVPIVMQFAAFLDESGYVGVYETLDLLLAQEDM